MTEIQDRIHQEIKDFTHKNVILVNCDGMNPFDVNFDQVLNLSLLFSISSRMTFYPLYTNILKCLHTVEEASQLIIKDEIMEKEDHNIKNLMALFSDNENSSISDKIQKLILDKQSDYQPSRSFDDYPKSVDHNSVEESFFDNKIINSVIKTKTTEEQFNLLKIVYGEESNKAYFANQARELNDVDNKSRLKHWMFESKKTIDIEEINNILSDGMYDDRYLMLQSLFGPSYAQDMIADLIMLYNDFHKVMTSLRFYADRDDIESFRKEVWFASTKFNNISGNIGNPTRSA